MLFYYYLIKRYKKDVEELWKIKRNYRIFFEIIEKEMFYFFL